MTMIKNTFKGLLATCCICVTLPCVAETTIGIGAGLTDGPYRGQNAEWWPVPIIKHKSGSFFLNGFEAGVNIVDNEKTNFNLNASYIPLHFKPSKNDNSRMKKLNRRKATIMGGAGFTHWFDKTAIQVDLNADVLNRSDSVLLDVGVVHKVKLSEKMGIAPKVGATWANKDHNDYYFGVSNQEARRSGLKAYKADSSITPYVGAIANYKVTQKFSVFMAGRIDVLPSEVKNSPMIDRSLTTGISIGGLYTF